MPMEKQLENGLEAWLSGTISHGQDSPVSYFHATAASFSQFAPFQHFGSLKAAGARAEARSSQAHRTIEVWLAIRKPWRTYDDQAANNVGQQVVYAEREGLFTADEREAIFAELQATQSVWGNAPPETYNALKWECTMKVFARELQARGYDGLEYDNTIEEDLSYVPFRSDQIWWVDRDAPEP